MVKWQRQRTERLILQISDEESTALDEFQFRNRIPNRAEAARELMRRGLAVEDDLPPRAD